MGRSVLEVVLRCSSVEEERVEFGVASEGFSVCITRLSRKSWIPSQSSVVCLNI